MAARTHQTSSPAQQEPPTPSRTGAAAWLPFVLLGAWTLLVTLLLLRYGWDNHHVFRDETNAVLFGRDIADDLPDAVSGGVARGPERLTSYFAAAAALASDSPPRQWELLHVVSALCQGLVVWPLWLAGRELRLGRWAALVPAAIASTGSFAFYGIYTLNTSAALLTTGFLLWAMIRALARPGLSADLLVLASLGATVLARIGWAPLAAALLPAVLATTWLARPQDERLGAWLRALPRRLLERHPLLAPLGVVVALAAIALGPSVLLGGDQYGGVRLTPQWELSTLWDNTTLLGAHLAIGIGIVPFVLALPVLVRDLGRPADPVAGGFAWLVVGLVAIFSYAYYASMNEDRYFAVLAAPLVLLAAVALFRRPPPLWSTAVAGVVTTVLVATDYDWPRHDVYDYFVAPTSRFFGDVLLNNMTFGLSYDTGVLAPTAAAIAAVLAIALAAAIRYRAAVGRAGTVFCALVLLGLLAFQLAATDHPARKFLDDVGMSDTTDAQLSFIDRTAAGGAVEPPAVDAIVDPDLDAQLPFLQVFNSSLGRGFTILRRFPDARPAGIPYDVAVDWTSGRLTRTPGTTTPDLLLELAGRGTVRFAGEALPGEAQFPWARLQRLEQPLRVEYVVRGDLPDGYADRGRPMQVRVYPDATKDRCLRGAVLAHPFVDRPLRYRLSGGKRTLRGVVRPTEPIPFTLRFSATRPTTFTLAGGAGRLEDGTWRGPAFAELAVVPCERSG